jgi:hypothetical protein
VALGIVIEHVTEIQNFKSNWLKHNFWIFLTVPIFAITLIFFMVMGIKFLVEKVSVVVKRFNKYLDK